MSKSKQLQETATMILDSVSGGTEQPNVKAMRGIGYAILALTQFLRESDRPTTTIGKALKYNPCDCSCDGVKSDDPWESLVDGQT